MPVSGARTAAENISARWNTQDTTGYLQQWGFRLADDLDLARRELADRLDVHPMMTWSPRLLRIVVAAIDLADEPSFMPPEPGLRRLTVVR